MAFGFDPYANVPWRRPQQRNQISDPLPNYAIPSGNWNDITGTSGGGIAGQTGGLPMSNKDIEDFIRQNYGYMAAFMNHPEIGPILRQAARDRLDYPRMFGLVQPTKWFQTTNKSGRAYDILAAEDPAEAAAQAARTYAMIQNRARSMGLNMSDAAMQKLAYDATKYGWEDAEIVDRLLQGINWATLVGGDLTGFRDRVKQIGRDYLVSVSDATAQSYAQALASGEMTESGVFSIMQAQAASRFGWMADQIKTGITPAQYLMPVRDTIANELELPAEQVDMMDPKWLSMIETRDPKTGEMRSATLNEAMLTARRQPQYWDTNKAQQSMAGLGNRIAEVFGRRGL